MIADPGCPPTWPEYLTAHLAELAEMATQWDWPVCRRWSEKVFKLIVEGRIKDDWNNQYKIKDIQRDIIALSNKSAASSKSTYKSNYTSSNSTYTPQTAKEYKKDRDGKPCHSWNWGRDCGHNSTHGEGNDKRPHICAWCAYRYHKTNVHQERDCYNKKRFLERKAETTDTNKDF